MTPSSDWRGVLLKVLAVLGMIPAFGTVAMTIPRFSFALAGMIYCIPAALFMAANIVIILENRKWMVSAQYLYSFGVLLLLGLSIFLFYQGVINSDGMNGNLLKAFGVVMLIGCGYCGAMVSLLRSVLRSS